MKSRDMTVGAPTKNILLFSIPILLGSLFQQFYNLTDTIIVGRFLGQDKLAAVGSVGSIVFLVIGITTGLTQGFGVIISQTYGSKEFDRLKHLVALAMILTVICSLMITIPTVLLCRHLLVLLHTPENILEDANTYIRILYGGILFTMAYNMASSILRAIGDSRTPLYFLIFSSFLNIGLDILLITVVQLGTAGVALATILSQGVSALLCFLYMFRNFDILRTRRQDFYLDKEYVLKLIRISIPMALNHSITAMGIMILQSGINRFGSTVVASYTAAAKVEMLASQPMMALGTAMSTYCGQNLGAGKSERIYAGIRRAVLIAAGVAGAGMLFYLTCSRFVISWFIDRPTAEIYGYALQYLSTSAWFLPSLSMIYLFRSSLIGLNNAFVPILGGAVELICRFLCITFLLQPLGYWCIRLTNPITWTATAVIFIGYYIHWKRKAYRPAS